MGAAVMSLRFNSNEHRPWIAAGSMFLAAAVMGSRVMNEEALSFVNGAVGVVDILFLVASILCYVRGGILWRRSQPSASETPPIRRKSVGE